jgi:hypothetical protein
MNPAQEFDREFMATGNGDMDFWINLPVRIFTISLIIVLLLWIVQKVIRSKSNLSGIRFRKVGEIYFFLTLMISLFYLMRVFTDAVLSKDSGNASLRLGIAQSLEPFFYGSCFMGFVLILDLISDILAWFKKGGWRNKG